MSSKRSGTVVVGLYIVNFFVVLSVSFRKFADGCLVINGALVDKIEASRFVGGVFGEGAIAVEAVAKDVVDVVDGMVEV